MGVFGVLMYGVQDPTPAGDGGAMPVPGGMITNLDAMVQMSHFDNAGAGAWNDADMLQICNHRDAVPPDTRNWSPPTATVPPDT